METFLIGLVILFGGAFLYSKFCEKVFGPDDRSTPAYAKQDGVDYVPMRCWKNSLINLLNIAGRSCLSGSHHRFGLGMETAGIRPLQEKAGESPRIAKHIRAWLCRAFGPHRRPEHSAVCAAGQRIHSAVRLGRRFLFIRPMAKQPDKKEIENDRKSPFIFQRGYYTRPVSIC